LCDSLREERARHDLLGARTHGGIVMKRVQGRDPLWAWPPDFATVRVIRGGDGPQRTGPTKREALMAKSSSCQLSEAERAERRERDRERLQRAGAGAGDLGGLAVLGAGAGAAIAVMCGRTKP